MSAPLDHPGTGAALQQFEPERVDYGAHEAGGRQGGVQAGFPLWLAVWTIGKIGEDRSDLWRAFRARVRGQIRSFYGRDLRRPYPKAYPVGFAGMTRAGGGAFAGAATAWSVTINADGDCLLNLTGLPAGFDLAVGDYIGFKWDGAGDPTGSYYRRALVRAVAAAEANGSGAVQVMVEPPVPTAVPSGAVAHLDRPCCVMKLITDQSKLDAIDRRGAITGGTIAALQDLRP